MQEIIGSTGALVYIIAHFLVIDKRSAEGNMTKWVGDICQLSPMRWPPGEALTGKA